MESQTFIRKSGKVNQIYKLVDDNVPEIVQDQNKMLETINVKLGLASQVTLF